MKKLVRRGVCLLLISVMILSLAGCSKIKSILNGDFGGGNKTDWAKVAKDCVYKEVKEISLPDGMEAYSNTIYYKDGRVFVYNLYTDYSATDAYWESFDWDAFYADGEDWEAYEEFAAGAPEAKSEFRVVSMDLNGDDMKMVKFPLVGDNWVNNFIPLSADSFLVLYASYQWDASTQIGEQHYYVKNYDMGGNEKSSYEIKKDPGAEYLDLYYVVADSRGDLIYANNSVITALNPQGQKIAEVDVSQGGKNLWINNFFMTSDEQLICSYYDADQEKSYTKLVDPENLQQKRDIVLPSTYGCYDGGELYDIYYIQGDGTFMGYNFDSQEATAIFSPMDSDINPNEIGRVIQVDDTHIIGQKGSDDIDDGYMYSEEVVTKLVLLEKVKPEDVKDKEIITLGCMWMDSALTSRVMKYNKESDEYRLRIVNYGDYNTEDDWNKGTKQFNNDIITGNAPDIIFAGSNLNMEKYVDKGLFKDLNKYFDKDPDINRSDYNENMLNLCTSKDGKLCAIITSLNVNGYYMKKSIAQKDDLTLKELQEIEDARGILGFYNMTSQNIMNMGMTAGYDAFIDIKKGKCNFDSDAFIELLEYAKRYPREINWEELYEDENYWAEQNLRMRNNNCLIESAYISSFSDFNYNEKGVAGEDVVLMGFPLEGTSGIYAYPDYVMAIMKSCKHDDVAWDFIKQFLSDEYQDSLKWSCPIKNSSMQKKMEEAQEKPYWTDENGNKQFYDQTFWIDDNHEEPITPMTAERAQDVLNFINRVDKLSYYNEEIFKIVEEESEPFFAGEKTSAEVAKIIQSRVQLYVNENK